MSEFLVSPAATEDLRRIRDYIARDNPSVVPEVIKRLERAMQNLSLMPHSGHLRSDLADEQLRVFPVYSYLIIYRPESVPLEVVRVVSGYRDLSLAMELDEPQA